MSRLTILKLAIVFAAVLIHLSPLSRPVSAHQTEPPASADYPDFAAWLVDLRAEAVGKGIKPAVLDAAFDGVVPIPRII